MFKNIRRFIFYFILMAVLWTVLSGASLRTWWFGLPVAIAVSLISIKLLPPEGRLWSLKSILLFVPFFIRQSVAGGIDVARRALHPQLPLKPEFLHYSMRLPEGPARVFMACIINLLPGTLTAELGDGRLQVHTLDKELNTEQKLAAIEDRVAVLFGYKIRK